MASLEDHLREQTRKEVERFPNTQKLEDHQADYWKRSVVNSEIDRARAEREKNRS
jgi:hypothetical protein